MAAVADEANKETRETDRKEKRAMSVYLDLGETEGGDGVVVSESRAGRSRATGCNSAADQPACRTPEPAALATLRLFALLVGDGALSCQLNALPIPLSHAIEGLLARIRAAHFTVRPAQAPGGC